jgi:O-acetyl-ADP-ribose deacetylase (regulator of RNase III)
MKGNIEIEITDITELDTDAIVNAANSQLLEGGGVCGAIFEKAGSAPLTEACSKIGHCSTGDAIITPGFDLKAKYIIHAVGPIWHGGDDGEEELLYSAYQNSLILAMENDCSSIGFPVISSGIYGYPKDEAWQVALTACRDFLKDNPDYPISITFAVLSQSSMNLGEEILSEII